MNRRHLIKKLGGGVAISAVAPAVFASSFSEQKRIRIGIIGAENSHTAGFGKLFNIDKKFPGVELKYVWGETGEFARAAMEKGNIPYQVKDPEEMLGKIDALIVDHRHPKFHLEPAIPFIKAGIPTFIDKPFCYRASEGKEFLQLAKKTGTPVTSFSSVSHSSATFDCREQLAKMSRVTQVLRTGTADFESEYGGIFFYGVHVVEPLLYLFNDNITEVKVTRNGKQGTAALRFESGMFGTLVFKSKAYGWETYLEADDKWSELKPRIDETDPPKNYADMVEMFRSGKEPRSHQSILDTVSVLEALEKSGSNEEWVEVKYLKLES
jgi:predicted dehydrogenase